MFFYYVFKKYIKGKHALQLNQVAVLCVIFFYSGLFSPNKFINEKKQLILMINMQQIFKW